MTQQQKEADCPQEALLAGFAAHDQSASERLLEPYRRELLLHSYRLLGSLYDAEDAVQETMLRAWRHSGTFTSRGPGSLRTWLYTIATNASLDVLKKRTPRSLPVAASPVADPKLPVAPKNTETLWLEPLPENWLVEAAENPEARYARAESISLAFLTALQALPPRQRAILLLSDVLDWRASEVAHLLEISVSAVNSALHRARATLEKNYHGAWREMTHSQRADTETQALLARYVRAWENDDVDGLVALLKEDATLSMPPVPSWYQGPAAIRTILQSIVFPPGTHRRWRLLPTRANGQYAFALYKADEATKTYLAHGIQVVTLDHLRQIADITAFMNPELIGSFCFPPHLPQ